MSICYGNIGMLQSDQFGLLPWYGYSEWSISAALYLAIEKVLRTLPAKTRTK